MEQNKPVVSVVMPVYNTREEYLRTAIDSILNQTYKDFELIILDDASNEETKKILRSYTDPRVIVYENPENKGITESLNIGLELAKGEYIVRMDADDYSMPERIEKCLAYMEEHKDVNILGTYIILKDKVFKQRDGISPQLRKALLMVVNAGPAHPSVMLRKSFLDEHNLRYDVHFRNSQDYELWTRCVDYTDIHIYPEALFKYRVHEEQATSSRLEAVLRYSDELKTRMILRTGIDSDEEYIGKFIRSRSGNEITCEEYKDVLKRMRESNLASGYYDQKSLEFVTSWYLYKYIKSHFKGFKYIIGMISFMFVNNGIQFLKLAREYSVL